MRKLLCTLVLILLCSTAHAGLFPAKLALSYSLLLEEPGGAVATNFLREFHNRDGLRLRLRPGQDCHVYLVVAQGDGRFRILFPASPTPGANLLRRRQELVWPQQGWLRLDEHPGVDRIYLIASGAPVAELEELLARGEAALPEPLLLEIRDRYHRRSFYAREVEPERIVVRFKAGGGGPAVLVEEIAIRHN